MVPNNLNLKLKGPRLKSIQGREFIQIRGLILDLCFVVALFR